MVSRIAKRKIIPREPLPYEHTMLIQDLTALRNRERQRSPVHWQRNMSCRCCRIIFICPEAATITSKLLWTSKTDICSFVRRTHRYFTKTEEYMVIAVFIWYWESRCNTLWESDSAGYKGRKTGSFSTKTGKKLFVLRRKHTKSREYYFAQFACR